MGKGSLNVNKCNLSKFKSGFFCRDANGYSQQGGHSSFLRVVKLIFRNKHFWNVKIKILYGKSNSNTQHGILNPGAKIGVTGKLRFLIGRTFFIWSNCTNIHYNAPVQNVGLSIALQLTGVSKHESSYCYSETKAEINLKVCFL